MKTYRIELPVFEGPMDLLLYLIKKNELDITDIPISMITEQYLEYLSMMQLLNVAVASEFLVMAATLMFIKSRMLLPQLAEEEGEAALEDPRAPLVQQLLEYQHYRDIALHLEERATVEENVYSRWVPLPVTGEDFVDQTEPMDLYTLFKCFLSILAKEKEKPFEIAREIISVEAKREELLQVVTSGSCVDFFEYVRHRSLGEIVAIFLALLDLVKQSKLKVRQVGAFGPIEVYR